MSSGRFAFEVARRRVRGRSASFLINISGPARIRPRWSTWENPCMSFDENPPSPERLVNTGRRTTKVNFGVAAGVLIFLLIGIGFLVYYAVTRSP